MNTCLTLRYSSTPISRARDRCRFACIRPTGPRHRWAAWVHPDDTGAQLLDGTHRAENISRPDSCGKAVVSVVRDAQRLGFIVERNDARYGSKDFLAGDARGIVDIVEDGRLDEIAALERAAIARPPPRATFASVLPISW